MQNKKQLLVSADVSTVTILSSDPVPSTWALLLLGFAGLGFAGWRGANGDAIAWNSNGSGGFAGQDLGVVSTSYQIAGVGDFNGDSKADILWRNTNGDAILWNSNSSGGFADHDLGVVATSWNIQGA